MRKSRRRLSRQFRTAEQNQSELMLLIQITRLYEATMLLAELTASKENELKAFWSLEQDHANGEYKSPPVALKY